MKLYEKIEQERKLKGITKSFLENECHAYRGKLTDFKKGKTTLSDFEIGIIAKILDVSADYLLGKTENPTTTNDSEVNLQDPINAEILEKFDRLSPQFRKIALDYLENLAKHQDS